MKSWIILLIILVIGGCESKLATEVAETINETQNAFFDLGAQIGRKCAFGFVNNGSDDNTCIEDNKAQYFAKAKIKVIAQEKTMRTVPPKAVVKEWEHGWKTESVTATRYENPMMGYNIGFDFPRNPDNCDDARIFEFMEKHGGFVYQGGGSPGAEMFVIFKDVSDKKSAEVKLKQILPDLEKLIRSL